MSIVDETIEYDKWGNMKYHPSYHPNHGTRFEEKELIYLCKFWEYDNWRDMSFALGRTEKTLALKVSKLRKNGRFEIYKNMKEF